MSTLELPDLGEGLEEAEIVSLHVEVGDHVATDQPLISVETDKAVVEIPAPWAGHVTAIHVAAGDLVRVGQPLIDFANGAAVDTGTVVGHLPEDAPREATAPSHAPHVKALPAVRALAKRLGVDLASVSPSGADGAITADDVKRVAKVLAEVEPPEPLRGVRAAMARAMAQTHAEVAATTISDMADVEAWVNDGDVTGRLVQAMAAGCRASPDLNAWYDAQAGSRRVLGRIDLGIAVDTDEGLFVPVMRDVGGRDAADIRAELDALRDEVHSRAIPPEKMRGATITLSNFGVFGVGRSASLMVVPPQVAIVGAGRIHQAVVAADDQPAVHRLLPLSLTFDHRVVTGGEAARFLKAMIENLEG